MIVRTPRMRLVRATPEHARADLAGPAALAKALGASIPPEWPPEHFDPHAIRWCLGLLESGGPDAEWMYWYMVREDLGEVGPVTVGTIGFKGAPRSDGSVELGYSVLPEHRRKGLASEAVAALVERAFDVPEVTRVLAETLPALLPSIGVLERNGFRLIGAGSEPGIIRYEITRHDHDAGRTWTPPHLHTLVRLLSHLEWADRRVHSALARAGVPASAAMALYAHVLAAEALWIARLRDEPPTVPVWPALGLDDAHALSERTIEDLRTIVWRLEPPDLDRLVTYRTSAGDEFQSRVEDILLHLALHGTYHRGQVAMALRGAGLVPEPTDFIFFVRGSPAATSAPAAPAARPVVYAVTVEVDRPVAEDWLEWMRRVHVPEVLAAGGFTSCQIGRREDPPAPDGTVVYVLEYLAPSAAALTEYRERHAPALQRAHTERYGTRARATRTVRELLAP